MPRYRFPSATPIQRHPRPNEIPATYPKGRRCPRCACYLNIYNLGPLCHPCSPGGEGIVLQVAPDRWRRFTPVELLERVDYEQLMAA